MAPTSGPRDQATSGAQTGDFFERTSGARRTPEHLPYHPHGGSPAHLAHLSTHRRSTRPLPCSSLTAHPACSLLSPAGSSYARWPARHATILGSIHAYSSSCERRAAARCARPPPRGAAARRACWMAPPRSGASGANVSGCTRPRVMLVVGRAREAAAPSWICHVLSVEPLSSVGDARGGPLFFTFTQFWASSTNVNDSCMKSNGHAWSFKRRDALVTR